MYDSATHDKADGVEYHRKFRIRTYEDGRRRLEYKIKNGNLTMKETLVLDDDMEKALVGRDYSMIEKKLDLPLIKELFLKMKVDNLEVRQYVDYFREIYIFNNNEVRITFDRDLMVYNVANPNQKYKILEPNQIIMEVKYRKYLPDTIRKIVFQKHYHPIPYSKYLMGWLKLNNWGV